MIDNINKPSHYHSNGTDVIGFAEAQFSKEEQKGFHRINAIKYITRYDRKNGIEDLNKAKFYIDKLIELEESKPLEFDGNEPEEVRNNDGLVIFMEALSNIKSLNPDINNDIITYRAGTNPLD